MVQKEGLIFLESVCDTDSSKTTINHHKENAAGFNAFLEVERLYEEQFLVADCDKKAASVISF